MATPVKPRSEELYEADFDAWATEQASLLRAGRFQDLDVERLVEEVDDLGGALYRSVRSRVRTVMEHLLKLQYAPAEAPRAGWRDTVLTQRRDLIDDLTPSLGGVAAPRSSSTMRAPATRRPDRCATTARMPLPTPCRTAVPTPSSRSSATGCLRGAGLPLPRTRW